METTTPETIFKSFAANDPQSLYPLQYFLEPHTELIATFWIVLWILTALYVVVRFYRDYRRRP